MANFKMLKQGRRWALRGLGWLHVAPGGTLESTAAALAVSGYRTLVVLEVWVTISSDPFTSQLVSMHESEESRLECPSCIGLAPHTS